MEIRAFPLRVSWASSEQTVYTRTVTKHNIQADLASVANKNLI